MEEINYQGKLIEKPKEEKQLQKEEKQLQKEEKQKEEKLKRIKPENFSEDNLYNFIKH